MVTSNFALVSMRAISQTGRISPYAMLAAARMLPELDRPNIHIRDRGKVDELMRNLIQGGPAKLQVIADFDRTLTRFRNSEGKLCSTCHNALDQCPRLPESYREKAIDLRDHYYAIEVDPSLSLEEKYPFMVEWWTKAHDLLVQCPFTQEDLEHVVADSSILLRDGCDGLLQELHEHKVPVLIFSAGLGDIIERVVVQQAHMHSNIKIVSNYMDFDNQGKLVGFKGDMIHIFNKNEGAIHRSDYFLDLAHRENILLLGDSMGDLRMADGATNNKNLLKIGFLNDKIETSLPLYMDAFDIVLVGEETLDLANSLLKKIVTSDV